VDGSSWLDRYMEAAILDLKNHLDGRLTKQDALIERLYVYVTREFERVDARFESLEQRIRFQFDGFNTRFDEVRGIVDTDEIERAAQSVQLDRHETALKNHELWIEDLRKHSTKPGLS